MNHESIYDNEIAPQLLAIAKRCEELNISFVAAVEYAPGEMGRTETCTANCGIEQKLVHWAARCKGNVDSLFIAIDKHAKEHGHNSIYLQLAGNKNVVGTGNEFAAFTIRSSD